MVLYMHVCHEVLNFGLLEFCLWAHLCVLDDSDNEKDERKFEKRKAKSMAKARDRCLPMNFTNDDAASGILKERARIGSSLADVDPMNIDRKVILLRFSALLGDIGLKI